MNTNELPTKVNKELQSISKIASYMWQREWVERNGGNISFNLTSYFQDEKFPEITNFTEMKLPRKAGDLFFFVTGAGCYLRSLIANMEAASCIIYINKEATGLQWPRTIRG